MHRLIVIDNFDGRYEFLSNFSPHQVLYRGIVFKTSEHAYQWAKSTRSTDQDRILRAPTPGAAKRVGQKVEKRAGWYEGLNIKFMRNILAAKFAAGTELAQWLLDTGDCILIEGNNHGDRFWGQVDGEGENWLGQLLMERRDVLRKL